MAAKKNILLQLDTDARHSVFDSIVAVDAGVDVLLPYSAVTPESVRELVHGAIFTRGVDDLASTAIFIGGSDVSLGERVLEAVRASFFGPFAVSVLLDSNGANTTAAAAVLAAARHAGDAGGRFDGCRALVLGATGPVGRRVARLLARSGASVVAASRSIDRAAAVAEDIRRSLGKVHVVAAASGSPDDSAALLEGADLLVAAGAAGVQLCSEPAWRAASRLRVAIDLNAVPPAGVAGVSIQDAGKDRDGRTTYGAIGIGGLKMKIHKACLAALFTARDRVLDADEIFRIGREISARS